MKRPVRNRRKDAIQGLLTFTPECRACGVRYATQDAANAVRRQLHQRATRNRRKRIRTAAGRGPGPSSTGLRRKLLRRGAFKSKGSGDESAGFQWREVAGIYLSAADFLTLLRNVSPHADWHHAASPARPARAIWERMVRCAIRNGLFQ